MNVTRRSFLTAAGIASVGGAAVLFAESEGSAQDKEEKPKVSITSPKDGAKLDMTEDLEGKLNVSGWPVIVVKPLIGSEPWYVQPAVEEVTEDGDFAGVVYIGDGDTKPGTRFRLIVFVVKTKAAAERYRPGMRLKTIPAGRPRSERVTVTRAE